MRKRKTTVQQIEDLLLKAEKMANKELDLVNIFYNERFIELFIAERLGHKYGNNTQGGDAIESDTEKPTEYKAINTRSKSGKGTFQFHWLSENKIEEYKKTENMYFAIRDGITILKIYKVSTEKIMPLVDKNATGSKDISGHAGFSESTLIEKLKADLVYERKRS
jgi:hypothetical protein